MACKRQRPAVCVVPRSRKAYPVVKVICQAQVFKGACAASMLNADGLLEVKGNVGILNVHAFDLREAIVLYGFEITGERFAIRQMNAKMANIEFVDIDMGDGEAVGVCGFGCRFIEVDPERAGLDIVNAQLAGEQCKGRPI